MAVVFVFAFVLYLSAELRLYGEVPMLSFFPASVFAFNEDDFDNDEEP